MQFCGSVNLYNSSCGYIQYMYYERCSIVCVYQCMYVGGHESVHDKIQTLRETKKEHNLKAVIFKKKLLSYLDKAMIRTLHTRQVLYQLSY